MKRLLLFLLLCPLALLAQGSWDVSPLGINDTPQENAASISRAAEEASGESEVTPAENVDGVEAVALAGQETTYPLIMAISPKGWLQNVKYGVEGQYVRADEFEHLLNMNAKAAGEVRESKSWAVPYVLGLVVAIAGLTLALSVDNEKLKTGSLIGGIGGISLELYSVYQSNKHLNEAVDIYNREGPDEGGTVFR